MALSCATASIWYSHQNGRVIEMMYEIDHAVHANSTVEVYELARFDAVN